MLALAVRLQEILDYLGDQQMGIFTYIRPCLINNSTIATGGPLFFINTGSPALPLCTHFILPFQFLEGHPDVFPGHPSL